MPKNLVIVESPAKARTIERYLGADYRVLASYGHVRDLPENPGKGKFGVDVDHDFAPEYVISRRPPQAGRRHREGRPRRRRGLPRDRPRPRGRGDRLARRRGGARAGRQDPAGDLQRDHRAGDPRGVRQPARDRQNLVDAQQARRIVDRLVGYTLSPLLSRKVRGGLSAGRVQSVAVRLVVEREREIDGVRRPRVLDASRRSSRPRPASASRPSSSGSTARRSTSADDGDRRAPRRAAIARPPPGRHARSGPGRRSARRRRRSRRPPSSRRRAAGSASARSARCRSPSGCTRASRPREGQVGLITYMRTDSTAIAGVAMGEAREVIGERYGRPVHDAQGPRLQDEVEGRPGGPRVDPADELPARPGFARRVASSPTSSASTGSSGSAPSPRRWRPRSSRRRRSSWPTAPTSCARRRRKVLFDGFARVYTEGRDDDAPRRTRRRAAAGARRGRPRRRVVDVTPTQHFTEPPPRFTEATLIKALEEHGIGRPSTYAATISTIIDRGYVRVEERRLHPELVAEIVTDLLVEHFGDYVDVAFTARMEEELDEVARGEREWVPLLRAFYGPLRDRVDEKRRELKRARLHDRGDRRGLLARATRWSSGSAATAGSSPARSIPEHKESRPLPGRGAAAPGGDRRGLPEVRRGDARRQARPVRPVRRLLALPGLRLHQEGRPAAARPAAVRGDLPEERGRPPRRRVARDGPGTSSGGAPTTRAATSRRTTSRSVACTTPTTGRSRARARRRSAWSAARRARRRPTGSSPASGTRAARRTRRRCARPARARGGPRAGGAPKSGRSPARRGPVGRSGHDRRTRPVEPAADA